MITQAKMNEALNRIRRHERLARAAASRADNHDCYAELEKCQHAAFDAKALFNGSDLPDEED